MNRPVLLSILFSIAGLASHVGAQDSTIYRGLDDKGHVVYSNSAKGLRNAQKVALPQPAISGTVAPSPPQASPSTPRQTTTSTATAAAAETGLAQNALAQALADQTAGKEPLPGERLGTAGGGSRLSPSYFSRQDELAKEVKDAQLRFDGANKVR
jgi:hypothetical protein